MNYTEPFLRKVEIGKEKVEQQQHTHLAMHGLRYTHTTHLHTHTTRTHIPHTLHTPHIHTPHIHTPHIHIHHTYTYTTHTHTPHIHIHHTHTHTTHTHTHTCRWSCRCSLEITSPSRWCAAVFHCSLPAPREWSPQPWALQPHTTCGGKRKAAGRIKKLEVQIYTFAAPKCYY